MHTTPAATRRLGIAALMVLIALAVAAPASACIFTYTLIGESGSVALTPDTPTAVEVGQTYRIDIAMREDHGNCRIEPEDTLFLLDEARWRLNRETQPMVLLSEIVWQPVGTTRYTTTIEFRVGQPGLWTVDVIRECTRGGYRGALLFEAG